MDSGQLGLRQAAVFISALIYWGGVLLNAQRVRKHIGRSPNLKPGNVKERLLWLCWFFIIIGWAGQPLIIQGLTGTVLFSPMMSLIHSPGCIGGLFLLASGYAGTLWCYSSLGDSWRIGIKKREKTPLVQHGPYRYVRHPIYVFQVIILIGAVILLPTLFSLLLLLIHVCCVLIKALDEEAFLKSLHGSSYQKYLSITGRFFPKLKIP
jgi:protein-S-isoprenylcysteine O-methyltransferase Ste14